jgi:hypothetical protein
MAASCLNKLAGGHAEYIGSDITGFDHKGWRYSISASPDAGPVREKFTRFFSLRQL